MTVDDRGRRPGGEPRSVSRDLERYAALFASRTKVMKSSAMRDLMAITERPEVISLAGGLPYTSTFPAESLASILSKLAAADSARALQYAPTEGLAVVGEAIATVMAAEGMHVDPEDVLVTTGGQQVIDLVCKTLVDPVDVIVAEGPTYPGAVPAFMSYEADVEHVAMDDQGMQVDVLEETLDRLDAEGRRPKFIYTIPNFHNPGGVTMSLPRRRRLVEVARERELLVLEKLNLGKQATDLCSSAMTQFFVATYFAHDRWQDYLRSLRELYRRRRDTMLDALAEHLPREARWTSPEGGLFIWVTLPDYIDTTDLLARALSRNVAFVPGRAAFTDGRGGSSMRLNFSGVGDDDIREGVRRIGEVVREQVGLYGTLTGARPDEAPATGDAAPRAADPGMADVLELPRRRRGDRRSDAR